MAKAQLTKGGLKRQKDDLKRYLRFLPTLELKKQQLLAEIRRVQGRIDELERESLEREESVKPWVAVLAEGTDIADWARPRHIRTSAGNIAGIAIPVLEDVDFEEPRYDFMNTPLWVDRALPVLREEAKARVAIGVALEQQAILRRELRTTIQRIKLFEEVKIPEAREAIRVIQIFLGDLRTAEVVRGKIAKSKIERKRAAEGSREPVMIVPMKRLALLVAKDGTEEALRRLRRLGVVHIKHVREPESAEVAGLAEQSARLEKALALLGPETERPAAAASPASFEDGMRVVDAILDLDKRREKTRSRLQEAEAQRGWLKAWGDPSRSDLESLAEADIKIRLYLADAGFLKGLPEHGQAFVVGRDRSRIRLAWLTRGGEAGLELKEETFPEAEVSGLEDEIAAGQAALTKMAREAEALSGRRDSVRAYARHLRRSTELARVRAGMGLEEDLVYLEGYCPGDRLPEVTSLAEAHSWGWLASEPEDPSGVPTLIRNPGWIQAIQPLFKFMGTLPGYAEADVSPWFLGFLSLFCAMLIGDAGYGLLFLGAALWARRKARPGTPPDLFRMMILFSLATILWGALSGVYFGSAAVARVPVLRSLVVPALDGFVEANSASLMYLCFIIGLVHLTLAHLLNVFRLWPSPRLLGQVGWMAIVWAVFFLVGNLVSGKPLPDLFGPLLIGGVFLALVFSNFQRRILKGVAATLVDLPLSIISTFSDLMSYLRLFAVGFASLTVAGSFNAMAAGSGIHSIGQGIMAAVILLFGHSLNLVLGGMSVLVHGVRLNMLEFSSHLGQQWSGLRYEPFREGEAEERGRNPERKERP